MFVLDATGSMSGLIEGAKRKVWSIANAIASGKPTPDVRMGLVGYRDRGDEYVTKVTPLTDDLDKVFKDLTGFVAGGGGDGPESVNQALRDALLKAGWSPAESDAMKVIFLVGDAPPHMDYEDDVKYMQTVEEAVKQNIMVNTVQCGSYDETAKVWQDIARRGEGKYVALEQGGGMVSVETPFDKDIAEVESKIGRTFVRFGSREALAAEKAKEESDAEGRAAAGALAPSAAADRAEAKARRSLSVASMNDLVEAVFERTEDLSKVPEDQLPEELKGKKLEEKMALLQARWEERKDLKAKMEDLAAKRAAFIKAELEKKGAKGDAFDEKVKEMLREKAKKAGVTYE
ncbi:MAG: VWA domain-containing protein [Planctomycetes bacterium]|nr:VWA domain-containing protein [Planctomycetota bacterium]